MEFPKNYFLTSELDIIEIIENKNTQTVILNGKDRIDSKLFLNKLQVYKTVQTDKFSILSNIQEKGLQETDKAIITYNIINFISDYLGDYPHTKLIVSDIDAKKDPVYGLNQLPDFIRPFPENFQDYEVPVVPNSGVI